MFEVGPAVAGGLAAAGAFDVHNLDYSVIELGQVSFTRSFDHHGKTGVKQRRDQLMDALLKHRLAACDLDQIATIVEHSRNDFSDRLLKAFMERIRGVAPDAAQIT